MSSHGENYVHTRKYLGVILKVNAYNYFAPLSSPKKSDYILVNGERTVRKTIIPIIRMTESRPGGEKTLLGTIKLNNMIPVPETELVLYDVGTETDSHYRDLIGKKLIFIRKK